MRSDRARIVSASLRACSRSGRGPAGSRLRRNQNCIVDDPESPGNPASKSGLNYADIGGDAGVSRDNFYYIDGINVTDGVSGTFGDAIRNQDLLAGAGGNAFGDGIRFTPPRRVFIGARFRFDQG